jgi:hypothetical protein
MLMFWFCAVIPLARARGRRCFICMVAVVVCFPVKVLGSAVFTGDYRWLGDRAGAFIAL